MIGVQLPVALRVDDEWSQLDTHTQRVLLSRATARDTHTDTPSRNDTTRAAVSHIVDAVRARGDDALRAFAKDFDGVDDLVIEVPRAQWARALNALGPAVRAALEHAVQNLTTVHAAFRPVATEVSPEPGVRVGRRPDPLARVGIYAPGGRAAYPSSLLMGAIPARVAGVGEIVVCSPPDASGVPSPVVLAAAALAGVDRLFALGGAGAIAAMACGTDTVPRVDRIVGPGNAYVAEAKLQLAREVLIDAPAGPSELLVLADATADVDTIAAEMVAQAEHDPDAAVVTVLCGSAGTLAAALRDTLARRVDATPRATIVREALAARGAIVRCASVEEGIVFANHWAAEHLLLLVDASREQAVLSTLRNVGTVFVGPYASVAFGDYMTGANHVLPTNGAAARWSGLSTLDFVRWTTWQSVSPAAAEALAPDTVRLAEAEALPAHAAAATAAAERAARVRGART